MRPREPKKYKKEKKPVIGDAWGPMPPREMPNMMPKKMRRAHDSMTPSPNKPRKLLGPMRRSPTLPTSPRGRRLPGEGAEV